MFQKHRQSSGDLKKGWKLWLIVDITWRLLSIMVLCVYKCHSNSTLFIKSLRELVMEFNIIGIKPIDIQHIYDRMIFVLTNSFLTNITQANVILFVWIFQLAVHELKVSKKKNQNKTVKLFNEHI